LIIEIVYQDGEFIVTRCWCVWNDERNHV